MKFTVNNKMCSRHDIA